MRPRYKNLKSYETLTEVTTIKDVVDYLRNFVQMPSFSGKERELALSIRDILGEFGLDRVHIDELGDVIGFVEGKAPRPLVLLEGHMDHVSPGNLAKWKHKPYAAEVVDGKIFGRGTVDMKAALAAMAFAAKEIACKEHQGTLALCFVVHEETVEGTAIGHIIEKELKEMPDLVVLGEATNLDLGIGHRGRAVINVELSGKTAHASMPELGLNALHTASRLITDVVEELGPRLPFHDELGKATITTISLDASPKGIPQLPDKARILFDRRIVLGETESDVLKPMKEKIDALVAGGKVLDGTACILEEDLNCWTGRKLRVKNFFPSWLIQETDIVQRALKSLRNRGLTAKTHVWRFSTDGIYTYGLRRIPTVGLGPGEEALAHQPNEYVRVKDVKKAVQAYVALAESFIS